ncbi:3-keto-5-aminohexanoate cleavage protein [Nostocoides australiense]
MLTACLNGARLPGEHPALPHTAEQLAADAVAVRAAGAAEVHIHLKNAAGADTLTPGPLEQALRAIRAAAPGMPVGVTTGAWAQPLADARVGLIQSWRELPDHASVNWHEDGAEQVAAALLERGIGVEAGLWTPQDVDAWLRSGLRDDCLRVLLELPSRDERTTTRLADHLLARLAEAGSRIPVLLHGEEESAWPAVRYARRLGLDTRIGLEDTLTLPDGSPAPDNAALLAAALNLA